MESNYVISAEHRCAFIKLSGEAIGLEFAEYPATVFSDSAWDPTYDSVWDCSSLDRLIMAPEHMDAMVERMRSMSRAGHTGRLVGIMAGSDHMLIAQLFSIHANRENRPSEAFESREEALAWLGLPADAWPASLG